MIVCTPTRGPHPIAFRARRLPVLVGTTLLALSGAAAASEFGVRIGSSTGAGPTIHTQEAYWRTGLPWRVGDPRHWYTTSQAEVNAARLSVSDESITSYGGGVHLWTRNPQVPVSFRYGTGPTYLSETEFGGRDFGGHWQFTSHLGIFASLAPNVSVGYRIQHTSNAGLYSEDDGYTSQAFELRIGN